MMTALTQTLQPSTLLVGAGVLALAVTGAVYLWSPNPGQRARAWNLIRTLLRR